MEHLTNIVAWIKAHWTDILTVWTCIIGCAEVIVKWTDSKKDDAIFGKIRAIGVKLISWLTKLWFEEAKAK